LSDSDSDSNGNVIHIEEFRRMREFEETPPSWQIVIHKSDKGFKIQYKDYEGGGAIPRKQLVYLMMDAALQLDRSLDREKG